MFNQDANDALIALFKGKNPPDEKAVEALLDAGARSNTMVTSGRTPAYFAAAQNNMALLQVLHKHGADFNVIADDGRGPLHHAIENKNFDMAEYLLANGADINAQGCGSSTPTPLHIAAHMDTIEKTDKMDRLIFLLDRHADVTKPNQSDRNVMEELAFITRHWDKAGVLFTVVSSYPAFKASAEEKRINDNVNKAVYGGLQKDVKTPRVKFN